MIRINSKSWTIKFVNPNSDNLKTSLGFYTLGACDNNSQTIYISNRLNDNRLRKVITHEITYAVMHSYHMSMDYEQEELFADLRATYGLEIITIADDVLANKKRVAMWLLSFFVWTVTCQQQNDRMTESTLT